MRTLQSAGNNDAPENTRKKESRKKAHFLRAAVLKIRVAMMIANLCRRYEELDEAMRVEHFIKFNKYF